MCSRNDTRITESCPKQSSHHKHKEQSSNDWDAICHSICQVWTAKKQIKIDYRKSSIKRPGSLLKF